LRFPLSSFFTAVMETMVMTPGMLSPNAILAIVCFEVVLTLLGVAPTAGLFRYLFHPTLTPGGWYYLRMMCNFPPSLENFESKVGDWRCRFFGIRDHQGESWGVRTEWEIPLKDFLKAPTKLSRRDQEMHDTLRDHLLLHGPYDVRKLVQEEILLGTHLS